MIFVKAVGPGYNASVDYILSMVQYIFDFIFNHNKKYGNKNTIVAANGLQYHLASFYCTRICDIFHSYSDSVGGSANGFGTWNRICGVHERREWQRDGQRVQGTQSGLQRFRLDFLPRRFHRAGAEGNLHFHGEGASSRHSKCKGLDPLQHGSHREHWPLFGKHRIRQWISHSRPFHVLRPRKCALLLPQPHHVHFTECSHSQLQHCQHHCWYFLQTLLHFQKKQDLQFQTCKKLNILTCIPHLNSSNLFLNFRFKLINRNSLGRSYKGDHVRLSP